MTRPNFDGRITLGNLITLTGMVAGAVFIWGQMDGRMTSIEDNVDRQEVVIIQHGERLRAVENAGSRQSATLDLILQELTELNSQLRALQERVAR